MGFKPCDCCKTEYRAALKERNIDMVSRMQSNYIYSPDSDVFHKCGCGTMYSANRIMGTMTYAAILKTGRRPCKLCRPTAKTEIAYPPLNQEPAFSPKIKPTLSNEENRAIKRQRFAIAERERLMSPSKNPSEKSLSERERNNIITLTQPGFAFRAGQGCRNFHRFGCPKLMSDATMIQGFSTFNEAVAAGHTPCRKCKPSAKRDVKLSIPITSRTRGSEKIKDEEDMCRRYGFSCHIEGEFLCVETPVGKWRIKTRYLPIRLEHINLVRDPHGTEYHVRQRLFLSVGDAVKYIKRHDASLENAPTDNLSNLLVICNKNRRKSVL